MLLKNGVLPLVARASMKVRMDFNSTSKGLRLTKNRQPAMRITRSNAKKQSAREAAIDKGETGWRQALAQVTGRQLF
jgi:hypothetical protein